MLDFWLCPISTKSHRMERMTIIKGWAKHFLFNEGGESCESI